MAEQRKDISGQYTKVSFPEPHIALVQLARAPVNAFNEAFWREFGHVIDTISKDPNVRVVVLASGLPKIFTAGIDLSSLAELKTYHQDPGRRGLQLRDHIRSFQDAISATERCPYPVIVAVHGAAPGLSIDMIAACDVRYAAENTRFCIKVRGRSCLTSFLPVSTYLMLMCLPCPVIYGIRKSTWASPRT
ncbi:hypothetical protein NM688_g8061 [Phlebia brevispora]|uniref:Uncharacterized protein n=1 Tax=Phlebia brevispora TaxID=194682 RepID=A0ACC1RXZ4_9APHY|nr:hypothetical protein NM688_g8061 [Phlebia brevispora]